MPPEGPWELQGIELLSQNELYRQILLLLHLLPQDLLLLQVRPLPLAPHGPGPPLSVVEGEGLGRHGPLSLPVALGLPCPLPGSEATECFSPQPCQSSYCYCQEVLDRLIQCGLLVAEEVGRAAGDKAPVWGLATYSHPE